MPSDLNRVKTTLVFPIVTVKKMPKVTVLGRYFERSKPRRIELSPLLASCKPDLRMFIMLHEVGHWFRYEHVPKDIIRKFKNDDHKKKKDEENFAHAFANYFLAKRKLKADEPTEHDLIEGYVRGHEEEIMAFAKRGLDVLAREVPNPIKL